MLNYRPPTTATWRIDAGLIAAAGGKAGAGRRWAGQREIDAGGLVATPGWVDIHTHYDSQVAWYPYLTLSSRNGVTT